MGQWRPSPNSRWWNLGLLLLAAPACGGDSPGDPGGGQLILQTMTTGADLDPDGYTLQVDEQPLLAIGINDSLLIEDLTGGEHTIELGGVASNCSTITTNPLAISITASGSTGARLEVSCTARTGVLQIRTFTSGTAGEVDGFVVNVDGVPVRAIPRNGATAVGVLPGEHQVLLDDLTAECVVDGPNPQVVTVAPEGVTWVTFVVACTSSTDVRGA